MLFQPFSMEKGQVFRPFAFEMTTDPPSRRAPQMTFDLGRTGRGISLQGVVEVLWGQLVAGRGSHLLNPAPPLPSALGADSDLQDV